MAHYSIGNHLETHKHYELFYSMQLLENPKDFKIQEYYTTLVDKEIESLTPEQLQKVIELYQFAIERGTSYMAYRELNKKLEIYEAALTETNKSS